MQEYLAAQTCDFSGVYIVIFFTPYTFSLYPQVLDWFFFLAFSTIVFITTCTFFAGMVYLGVTQSHNYNTTGTLRPFYGREIPPEIDINALNFAQNATV